MTITFMLQFVCIHIIPDQMMTFGGTNGACAIGENPDLFQLFI